jgi:GNAT superfamily N-acetyltransferase
VIGGGGGELCRAVRRPVGYMIGMSAAVTIRDLKDGERAWANDLYRAIRFETTPPGAVALVAELASPGSAGARSTPGGSAESIAGERIGLGRLVAHAPDVLELGGIWTDEAVRGRGIARAMVGALLERRAQMPHPEHLWCIPFVHLSAFYQSCGFALSAPPWPPSIAAKVSHCIEDGLDDVVVLVR